ncbi:hypothetical protein [Sporosarcina sp. NPDC096371]|uniref:hypothetical protein n=1 Tax=Sporosarcina sp. NPDC096371 TaxID=3364530 RepID=UPI0038226165
MKKAIYLLLMVVSIIGLSACGKNAQDDLQAHRWNVVSTNGEAYTAEFNKSTVSFAAGSFSRGFTYKIDNGKISLEEDEKEPVIFEVEKDGKEYKFTAASDDVKKQYGDLTLSPSKE